MAKAKRYKLNDDYGKTLLGTGIPETVRLEPGSHFTTEDPSVQEYLDQSGDVTEVKIPDQPKKTTRG